jgi:hypothetical protein
MEIQTNQNMTKSESFRFEIYRGKIISDGSFLKTRTVGHAYLRTGKHVYKVKLYGALGERFVIMPSDSNVDQYQILTKEEVRTKDNGKRTYWNVVGEGKLMSKQGLLMLDFDLYGKTLYMNLYPSNAGNVLPFQVFDEFKVAA